MKILELRIPPPLVGLTVAIGMWLAAPIMTPLDVPFAVRVISALAWLVIGIAIALAGVVSFRRAKTTVNPLKPESSSSLVSTGIYRHTRNPMYVGMAITLVGWAAYLASLPALLGVLFFVLYITQFQIKPEERVLASLFGAEYADYMSRVRRWL